MLGYPLRLIPEYSMLRNLRVQRGLSQQELAKAVGLSRRTIYSLERGLSMPSLSVARALSAEFDLAIEELFPASDLR